MEIRILDADREVSLVEKEGIWKEKEKEQEKSSKIEKLIYVIIFPFIVTLAVIFSGTIFIPLALIHAYVFQILWLWFIVPTFNMPELSFLLAFGVTLIFFHLTGKVNMLHKAKVAMGLKEAWKTIGMEFAGPFLTLLIGYIVKCYL